jgi:hypothetical protein
MSATPKGCLLSASHPRIPRPHDSLDSLARRAELSLPALVRWRSTPFQGAVTAPWTACNGFLNRVSQIRFLPGAPNRSSSGRVRWWDLDCHTLPLGWIGPGEESRGGHT